MNVIDKIIEKLTLRELRIKKSKEKKPSLIKEVIDHPESFKLEAFIEGDEVIVKIKRRES